MSNDERFDQPRLYVLTELTGQRANDKRSKEIASFAGKRRTWIVLGISAVVFVIVSTIAWISGLDEKGILVGGAVAAGVGYLLTAQASDGLRQRKWKELWARKNADTGKFYAGMIPIDPLLAQTGWLISNTVPGPAAVDAPAREDSAAASAPAADVIKASKTRARRATRTKTPPPTPAPNAADISAPHVPAPEVADPWASMMAGAR